MKVSLPERKEKPCGNNTIFDHIFDTDWPDGCCVCGWTWDEIKQPNKPKLKTDVNRRFFN